MFGAPPDKPGECNARLFLGDDYGDGTCTVQCQLEPGHEGPHQEKTSRCLITWEKDERYDCPKHGMQPEDWCQSCHEEESRWWRADCPHGVPREQCDVCEEVYEDVCEVNGGGPWKS